MHTLRTRDIKVSQVVAWHKILNRIESVEQLDESLARYADTTKLLNARKEEVAGYRLRLAQVKSQAEILGKKRAKVEARIDALKVAGFKELCSGGSAT